MSEHYVLHLNQSRCCMRAVKFRELSLPELDEIASAANESVGKDGTQFQYQQRLRRDGIKAMLVAISTEPFPANANIAQLDSEGKITWEPLTQLKLTSDMRWQYETLFRSKDEQLLSAAYNELHNVVFTEAMDLVGKAMTSTVRT